MLKIIGAGPDSELARTLNKFSSQKDTLKKELIQFINFKNQHPFNGSLPGKIPGFGDSDKKFRSGGKFDSQLPNLSHAHLTHNLSIVYYLDRETQTLRLYGIYSHDDLGTGNPPNTNRQIQMGQRFANMKFDASEPPTSLQQTDKPKQDITKPASTKPDYTPKPKQPTQQERPAPPTEPDRILQFANELDKMWPQRNIFNKLKQATTLQEKISVLTSEMFNLEMIRKRHALYPNQQKYLQGLETLFRYMNSKK
jgi:hypothetical protein